MKTFGMKHKIFLSILPFFVVFGIIGSGFALFLFDEEETNTSSSININVTNAYELGNIYLTKEEVTSSLLTTDNVPTNLEKDDSSLSTKLFFDYNNIYFVRSDNITKERTFNIYYYNSLEESDEFKYNNVSLNLEITIEDKNTSSTSGIQSDSTSGYYYSDRAVDYIDLAKSSTNVTISDETTTSTGSKEIDTETKKSYSYTILTGLTSNSNYDIDLDLIYTSTLAPSYSSNSDYFNEVINKMKTTMSSENTSISLNFYLSYSE